MGIINFTEPATGNFLVDIILWLVTITSSVSVGVILFTVILKLITLPFDYFSRALMRKNSLKMEEMRPELEKLQQQCANNKDLYNQKMMALYKKNGYSAFGACLPSILTLVIFIVAINGFTAYSKYQNQKYFYDMSVAYNNVAYAGFDIDNSENKYITYDEDKKIIVFDNEKLYNSTENEIVTQDKDGNDFTIFIERPEKSSGRKILKVYTSNGYSIYTSKKMAKGGNEPKWETESIIINSKDNIAENNVTANKLASPYNNSLKNYEGKTYAEARAEKTDLTVDAFIKDIQQTMSANSFRNEKMRFLWVKNIWVPDTPYKHPVEKSLDSFRSLYGYNDTNINDDTYGELIAKLEDEQNSANGYFIMVILTAGISLLMQLVMNKSQKAQMELQTVDGQGAATSKFMMWMMPIMMAVFAFIYTAAFSLYIIISSAISIGTTFLINFMVDKQLARAKAKAGKNDGDVIHGRFYTKEEEEERKEKENKKEKEKHNDKFTSDSTGDFLTGDITEVKEEPCKNKKDKKDKKEKKKKNDVKDEPVSVKHIRGRLK